MSPLCREVDRPCHSFWILKSAIRSLCSICSFASAAGINLSPQERKCALLFQNYQLFPNMTVADNVCAGVEDAGDASARKKLAECYLGIFGLADFADRYPARLSGGQQQRVAMYATAPCYT